MNGHSPAIILLGLVVQSMMPPAAPAQDVVVGVNVPYLNNPTGKATRVDQEIATLKDLQAAGVHVVRTGIAPNQTGIDYAKRLYDHGIKLHWEFGLQYAPNARQRPWQPDKFPNVWAQYPLSMADPDRFRASFQPPPRSIGSDGHSARCL